MPGHSRSQKGVAELVIGPATSGRTRWLAYRRASTSLRQEVRRGWPGIGERSDAVLRTAMPGHDVEKYVTNVLTVVTDIDTYTSESRLRRTRPGRQAPAARASADPAGGLATRSRAALGINPPAL